MVLKDGGYGAFHPAAGYGVPNNSKNAEAQLLSQATSTAMVAARSILMSGGTEEVALRTAKAAAQSVLTPNASDTDTISGRSTNTFMRRRKAKRQAEVVASMALMQAASNVRSGNSVGTDWDTLTTSTDNNTRSTNPYARNITTRSMQDEPSVLSGSTRPPKAPTPRSSSGRSVDQFTPSVVDSLRGKPSQATSSTRSVPNRVSSRLSARSQNSGKIRPPSPMLMVGLFKESSRVSQNSGASKKAAVIEEKKKKSSFMARIRSKKVEQVVAPPSEEDGVALDNHIFSDGSDESDFEAEETETLNSILADSSAEDNEGVETDGDDDEDDTNDVTINRDEPQPNLWKQLDPLLNSFTNTMNFTCSPLTSFMNGPTAETDSAKSSKSRKKKKKKERQERQERQERLERSSASEVSEAVEQTDDEHNDESFDDDQDVFSGDETEVDERDDVDGDLRGVDSYDHSDILKERYFSSSCSNCSASSVDSSQLVRELNSCSSSEGEIQVRSSIRETMEKIVSKSKKGSNYDNNFDTAWKSYELSNKGEDEFTSTKPRKQQPNRTTQQAPATTSNSKKNASSPSSKRGFFFKKRKGKS